MKTDSATRQRALFCRLWFGDDQAHMAPCWVIEGSVAAHKYVIFPEGCMLCKIYCGRKRKKKFEVAFQGRSVAKQSLLTGSGAPRPWDCRSRSPKVVGGDSTATDSVHTLGTHLCSRINCEFGL